MATGQEIMFNALIKFMGVTPEQARNMFGEIGGKVNSFDARLTATSDLLLEAVKQLTEINAKMGDFLNGQSTQPVSRGSGKHVVGGNRRSGETGKHGGDNASGSSQ